MAWSKMLLIQTVIVLLIGVILQSQETSSRVPKFAIGHNFDALYAAHHIDAPNEPHNVYRAYIRENDKELLVEPRIQVLPSTTTDTDDVCEYRILPPVRTANAGADIVANSTWIADGDIEETDEKKRTTPSALTAGSTNTVDDDYNGEDDDDDEDEDEPEELPFIIRPSKENKHEAVLEVTKPLNCEHKAGYQFDIVAVSCAGDVSESAQVEVKIEDVNEFEPKFSRSTYEATLEEGRLVDNILQVEAFDEDCSEEFSRIQRYEISDPKDSPFSISEKGIIRNIRSLNFTQGRHYFLAVVAYDAAGKKSVYPATVSINIIPVCTPQWKVSPERVDYVPDVSNVKLYHAAKLDLCPTSISFTGCNKIEKITGHVTLKNDHIGKGCDREDKLPLQIQRKRCSSKIQPHSSLIELLPNQFTNEKTIPKLGVQNDSNILWFDGQSTAIILPSQKLNPDMFNRSFTITTWLKRDAPVNRSFDHKFAKEHILCISDDRERSRHHVALYVRNCRLGLLLRREPRPGDQLTVFRPAEWRWNLDNHLCSGEWHHYTISVKYPDVKLFIDGKEFDDDAATEIIDDWALHPIKGLQTTTVIGACWQGSQNRMDQYLRGYLDGLSVLVNETEEESVVQCMQKCSERLTVPQTASSAQAVFSMLDSDENEMLVEGYDVQAFQQLIGQIGYENDRMYPAPGVRFVDMKTSFTCVRNEGNISTKVTRDIPDVRLTLKVAEAVPPTVSLSGPTTLTIDGMDHPEPDVFRSGVKILDSVTISVMRASSAALIAQDQRTSMPDYETMVKKFERDVILLDSCQIKLKNERGNQDNIALNVSEDLTKSLQMDVVYTVLSNFEKQWIIRGAGYPNEIPEFLTVLRDVKLKLDEKKMDSYGNVALKVSVSCTELFSKLSSSEYVLEVNLKNFEHLEKVVLHTISIPSAIHRDIPKSHLSLQNQHLTIPEPTIMRKHDVEALYGPRSVFSVPQFHTGSDVGHMSTTGAAITVVVVICVSFFIFLVFVGIVKIRNINMRTRSGSDAAGGGGGARRVKSRVSLRNLRKLRKSLSGRAQRQDQPDFDDEDDEDDLEKGVNKKADMKWDDEGMSITVNPLEEMQNGGNSDYDDLDNEDDDYHQNYDDGEMTEEEKENDDCQHDRMVLHDDEDSSAECEECSKPNRGDLIANQSPTIRRSQSCTEAFSKSKDSRMTRSELEWDDQI